MRPQTAWSSDPSRGPRSACHRPARACGDREQAGLATIPSRWVQTAGDLGRVAERLAAAGEVALDTEGDSLHHYPERLSLLQLAVPAGEVWLVDPLALDDLSALAPVFAGPGVTTVLHAGDNDLVHLKRRHGFRFASLFDTHVAARFLGEPALGLDVILDRYLGVQLPPSRQRDDWSARPLSEAQLHYAAADVFHLVELKARLTEELRRVGRLAWVDEECAALAAQPVPERAADPNAFATLKGARDLTPRGLGALRELHDLRERLARAADRPPFKILQAETLVRLAQEAPADREALGRVQGCTARVVERWGDAVLEAIARAQALPDGELPRLERWPRPRVPAVVQRRSEALRRWRAEATPRLGLEPGLLLPNRLIAVIAAAGPGSVGELLSLDGVRRWRAHTFGAELLAALASA